MSFISVFVRSVLHFLHLACPTFQEDNGIPKMEEMGKDYAPLQVVSSEYLIDHSTVYFLAADANRNLVTMTYAPHSEYRLSFCDQSSQRPF
jgi:gamma-glutamyltranspeptidase